MNSSPAVDPPEQRPFGERGQRDPVSGGRAGAAARQCRYVECSALVLPVAFAARPETGHALTGNDAATLHLHAAHFVAPASAPPTRPAHRPLGQARAPPPPPP